MAPSTPLCIGLDVHKESIDGRHSRHLFRSLRDSRRRSRFLRTMGLTKPSSDRLESKYSLKNRFNGCRGLRQRTGIEPDRATSLRGTDRLG